MGFARKQTQNSDNGRKVLSELKCPFTWELSSLKKENTHTLDSSLQGKPLLWAQWLGADRERCTASAPRLCFICIWLRLEIGRASSQELRAPQNAGSLSLPVSREGIFLSHTPSPLCLTGQVAWTIGQSCWEQKLQLNGEVSLGPGWRIPKQTQWGHLSQSGTQPPPLTHSHTAIPSPCLGFQRPTAGRAVLGNQCVPTAAQSRDTEAYQDLPTKAGLNMCCLTGIKAPEGLPRLSYLSRLLCPWDFPGKDTQVGGPFLLQGIFLTQESNPGLPHCRPILYRFSH